MQSANIRITHHPGSLYKSYDNDDYSATSTCLSKSSVVPLGRLISKKIADHSELTGTVVQALQPNTVANPLIVMYGLDANGVFTRIEGKVLDGLGLKHRQILGESVFDLCRDYPEFLGNIRLVLAGSELSWQSSFQNGLYEHHALPIIEPNGELNGLAGVAIDITQRCSSEEQLRLLAAAVQFAEDSIMITSTELNDPGPHILFVNAAFTKMTGYTAEEVLGRNPRFLQGPKTERSVLKQLRQTLTQGKVFRGQAINYRKDGTEFYNEWHIEPVCNEKGEISHYLAIQRDITQQKEAEAQLLHYAFHDSLTALPNRTLFMYHLEDALARACQSKDYLFAVLFLDLDHFKVINDSLGHLAGDDLLVSIAQRLNNIIRPQDTVARLGGDEFAIILDNVKDIANVSGIANRVQQQVRQAITIQGQEVFTTASIGIALSSIGYDSPEDIVRDADIAMYRAKTLGKARACVFNKTMHRQAVARLQLETDLRHALDHQEFQLYYQPIVSLVTGRMAGFEALVRWHHSARGVVSPADFIPVAEETGLINQIGACVLREACTQLRIWQRVFHFQEPLIMSVNISGKQFAQPDLIPQIERILQETGCPSQCLKLEITESVLMEQNEAAIAMLEDLKALGIQLSIDDFGTGYSSLSQLSNLPINTLKIDRSFINRIDNYGKNTEIVQAIISLAHSLGMDAIAEGVETAQQLYQLQELNCEFGQGYFFSPPIDSKAAENLLAATPECCGKLGH